MLGWVGSITPGSMPLLPVIWLTRVKLVGKFASFTVRYAARWLPYYALKYSFVIYFKKYGVKGSYRQMLKASRRLVVDPTERKRVQADIRKAITLPGAFADALASSETYRFVDAWIIDPVAQRTKETSNFVNNVFAEPGKKILRVALKSYYNSALKAKKQPEDEKGKINWKKESALFVGSMILMAGWHAYQHGLDDDIKKVEQVVRKAGQEVEAVAHKVEDVVHQAEQRVEAAVHKVEFELTSALHTPAESKTNTTTSAVIITTTASPTTVSTTTPILDPVYFSYSKPPAAAAVLESASTSNIQNSTPSSANHIMSTILKSPTLRVDQTQDSVPLVVQAPGADHETAGGLEERTLASSPSNPVTAPKSC